MSDTRPIGVFDSGLGGLTVLNAIKKIIPNENIVYVGDTARVPYGNKSTPLIVQYASQITKFLFLTTLHFLNQNFFTINAAIVIVYLLIPFLQMMILKKYIKMSIIMKSIMLKLTHRNMKNL